MIVYRSPCLKVPTNLGEEAIILLKSLNLFDRELRIQRMQDHLYIPLTNKPSPTEFKKIGEILPESEISSHQFSKRAKIPPKIIDLLKDEMPPHLLASLPRAIDIVGSIAIIKLPPEFEVYRKAFGDAIIATHRQVGTVLEKSGGVEGTYRVGRLEVIAGTGNTETTHKEHGCMYRVDPTKVYFSPRLSHEHFRVAAQVRDGETVVDMFAGVGPFSILIARKHENVYVYAIDVNPSAIHYLRENIALNLVYGRIMPILGDVKRVVEEELVGVANRVIMNLPGRAIEYIDVACKVLIPKGGIIHYYTFINDPKPIEAARIQFIRAVKKNDRKVQKILLARIVRGIAPFTWQVVVDAEIH